MDWNVWQNCRSEKGPILLLLLIFFLVSFRSIIGLIRWKMNKALSLSLSRYFSRSKPERIHFSFFLSCLRWQSVSSWLLSSPSYVTRCHESSYTSFLLPIGTLSNKHRISCYTPRCPRVFSINFIVFASLLREGIETLPDYYFVNFVLFTIGDVYTVYSELNFSRILKLFNLSNLLKSTKKFSTYRFKEYRNSRYSSRYSVVIQ